ncbi:hypothetical protein EMPG_12751, partial [Blastomyces silverae]
MTRTHRQVRVIEKINTLNLQFRKVNHTHTSHHFSIAHSHHHHLMLTRSKTHEESDSHISLNLMKNQNQSLDNMMKSDMHESVNDK